MEKRKLKILYLFLDGTRSSGVISKVKSKIRFLNELGLDVTGLFMNPTIKERASDERERIFYVPVKIEPLSSIYNRRYIREYRLYFGMLSYQRQFYRQLEEEVKKHDFDLVLFRYPLSNKFLLRFMRQYKNRVVFEHNSKELVEMALDEAKNPSTKYYIGAERKYGPRVLSLARALVGVGREVTQYEVERSGRPEIPNAVIPNGIDVRPLPVRKSPDAPGNEVRMLLVSGSPSPWVGIDLLLRGMANYKGPRKLLLSIVGPPEEAMAALVKQLSLENHVRFEGEKRGADLDRFFDESHIAIGTLAMQRVGLSEHSSLKVLEYASRGIPWVLGYSDTNFEAANDFAPFYLQTGYNGSDIDLEKVIAFADRVMLDAEHPQKLRKLAEMHLDFSVKMKELKLLLERFSK